ATAKQQVPGVMAKYPAFKLQLHDIVLEQAARRQLSELARERRVQAASVPVIDACGQLIVGFSPGTTLPRLEGLLKKSTVSCKAPPAAGTPRKSASQPRRASASTPGLSTMRSVMSAFDTQLTAAMLIVRAEASEDIETALPDALDGESATDNDEIEVPLLGSLRVSDLGLPLFTFLIGLIDGFNPCAMWVLVFLLSL